MSKYASVLDSCLFRYFSLERYLCHAFSPKDRVELAKCDKDVIIIGAGAAGMMCAIEAGKRGRSVLLLDHATKLGEKIRISGGGHCNFTNLHTKPEDFLSSNPDFCRSALARFTPMDFIALIEKHGIPYHEKQAGQLFCTGSSRQVIELLRQECAAAGVEWRMGGKVNSMDRACKTAGGNGFILETDEGRLTAESLVIATGGLSIPQIGAGPFGYRVAEQFSINVTPLRPALVPLIFAPAQAASFSRLTGVAIDGDVRCNGARFRGGILLTHRGLSGPAILQISSYWQPGMAIDIDLLPGVDATAWLLDHRHSAALLPNVLASYLPRRFAQVWCEAIMTWGASRADERLPRSRIEVYRLVLAAMAGHAQQYRGVQEGGGDTGWCRYL